MGHVICMQSRDQYLAALRVLDELPGTWHCRGPVENPVLLVTDSHYKQLVKAGVVSANGKNGKSNGKKSPTRKAKS